MLSYNEIMSSLEKYYLPLSLKERTTKHKQRGELNLKEESIKRLSKVKATNIMHVV